MTRTTVLTPFFVCLALTSACDTDPGFDSAGLEHEQDDEIADPQLLAEDEQDFLDEADALPSEDDIDPSPEDDWTVDEEISSDANDPLWALSHQQKIDRANAIKSVHATDSVINNPVLFAGIAQAETGMAHCYHEYSGVKCQGYYSSSACGGGPILAGGYDGSCSQGGLGMFQFDNGTQWQTRNFWLYTGMWPTNQPRHHDVADLYGNIRASIDFILWKAWYSNYTPYFSNRQAMYDWINSIRPIAGDPDFEHWLGFLAYNYNGQSLYSQGWYNTKTKYRNATISLYNDLGGYNFWYGSTQSCSPEGGLWCGGNGVVGDPNTLYVCTGGTLSVQSYCSNGCYYAPPGYQDYCY